MSASRLLLRCAGSAWLLLCLVLPAAAGIEDQLSAYTGDNATGYLQPIANALGASLNDGFFRSAYIPPSGLHVSLEVRAMGVMFSEDDETFAAVPEGGFLPDDAVDAPTIVGDGDAIIVEGDGGAQFAFPGGMEQHSFALAVPQLRISSVKGSELVIRYAAAEVGDGEEIGDISFWGFGLRHSISQYLREDFPADLALGFLYQSLSVGKSEGSGDLISSTALTLGAQASKRYTKGFATFEPYAGIGIDSFKMDVTYDSDSGEDTTENELDFERDTNFHLTLGVAFNLSIINLHADYSIAGQNSFSFGLALGNLMY